MTTNRVYGIDLGTTYSCIAYVDEFGKPVVVPNSENQSTTPSVVYFEGAGNTVVGQTAKDVAVLHPDRVVSFVKRAMGDPNWTFEADGQSYHPQDVSSFILKRLVNDAQAATGSTITDVVITCPAYFGQAQKLATQQAGELAGLNVRYVIPEPTAAAIAYGIDEGEDQVILVYDLGGGTFDITVIDIKRDAITVICTGGDHELGGKNWDQTIAEWFAQEFATAVGVSVDSVTGDSEAWQDLLLAAEKAKITLSTRTSFQHKVQTDAGRKVVELTRDKFDELTDSWLGRTLTMTDDLLATAKNKGYAKIDKLLLVGGSTYMPQVIDAVKARYPFEVQQFDPNQAVAKGAALFGFKCSIDDALRARIAATTGQKAEDIDLAKVDPKVIERAESTVADELGMPLPGLRKARDRKIINVTSKSFGIVVLDAGGREIVNNLIIVDEAVPKTITRRYSTFEEGQTGVLIECMENLERVGPEGSVTKDVSTSVGQAELPFDRALPKGSPVEITFSLAEDGLLSVHGKDLTTNRVLDATFKTEAVLSREEIEEKKSRNLAMQVS